MHGAIVGLFAGVPVSDLDASIEWYTRFFGRPPDMRAGDEILWDIDEHATLFIEPNAAHAGAGRITLGVTGLDALLDDLAAAGIERGPIETYSNGVRHVTIADPDGNAIAFAEAPEAGVPSTLRTKSGRTLSDADIHRLAERAEKGIDLSDWTPRRGRPSLDAAAGEHSPRIAVRVPKSLRDRVAVRATNEGRSVSDVVRGPLEEYAPEREALASPSRRHGTS